MEKLETDLTKLTDEELSKRIKSIEHELKHYKDEVKERSCGFIQFFEDASITNVFDYDKLPSADDLKKYINYCLTYEPEEIGCIGSDGYEPYKYTTVNIEELIVLLKHILEVENEQEYTIVSNCSFERFDNDAGCRPIIYYSLILSSKYDKKLDGKVLRENEISKYIINNNDYVVTIPFAASEFSKNNLSSNPYLQGIDYLEKNRVMEFGTYFNRYYAKFPKAQNIFKVDGEIGSNVAKASDILRMYINDEDEIITKAIFIYLRFRSAYWIANDEMIKSDYIHFTYEYFNNGKYFEIRDEAYNEISPSFKYPRRRKN